MKWPAKWGAKVSAHPEIPPNAADPKNNIVPENRSLEAAMEDDVHWKPKVALPKSSKALSIVLNNPKDVRTRKVALLIAGDTEHKSLAVAKAAFKKAGIQFESVIPKLSLQKNNEEDSEVEQCLSSTPSHSYDGVLVLTNTKSYAEPKDVGAAIRFIGQAFKHCKTIGGVGKAEELIGQATMDLHEDSPGVILAKSEFTPSHLNQFIAALSEHRHWEREAFAEALPY